MGEQQEHGPVAATCSDCGETFVLESSADINKYLHLAKEAGEKFHCAECEKRAERKSTLKMQLASVANKLGFHFGV